MAILIDCILYFFLYLLIGLLFTKFYTIFFPDRYNHMNWWASTPEEEEDEKKYDKNIKYRETGAYGIIILFYPFYVLKLIFYYLWHVISFSAIILFELIDELITHWLGVNNKEKS